MGKVIKCSIIISDDFNNVLIAERGKGKKDSPKLWSIISRNIRGKEDGETCISKAVDKELGCTLFDAALLKEYVIDKETGDTLLVFTGKIREMITLHKEINKVKWVSGRELEKLDFAEGEKEILFDYFNSAK